MNLPEFSIKRPVTVIMIALIFTILGAVSLLELPVELYPNTSFGEVSIIIYVRGQIPPTEVESQVTKIVEDAVATVSNLRQLLSISKEGESTVVLSFEPGTDMDFAALEVREKFSRVKNKLPKEIEKPVIAQFKQNDVPVLIYALTSPVRKPEEIRTLVDETVKDRLKRVNGVANVEVAGGRERKILVEIDQQKMVAYGATMDEINQVIGSNNLNLLSGEVERKDDKLLVRMIGEFADAGEIKEMPVKVTPFGSVLRIGDIATSKYDYMEPGGYARHNTSDIVSIYIQKESMKNTIHIVKNIQKEVEAIRKKIPPDINFVATSNQSAFIEKSIASLNTSLLQGTVLIFLIFFLFLFRLKKWQFFLVLAALGVGTFIQGAPLYLMFFGLVALVTIKGSLRSVLIVTLCIPVSCIATFLFMKYYGLTLNVMTLFGLALGVGMLVDNSIVVFDNILKKREQGVDIYRSAVDGSQEVILQIVASTLCSVIVFLPLIFMSKEIQLLYSSMAMTVIVSLLISLVCSLTIVPLVCSMPFFARYMGAVKADKKWKSWDDYLYLFEKTMMLKALRRSKVVITAAILLFACSMYWMSKMPMEYMGSTDQNKFTTFIEMPTGTRLDITNDVTKRVEKLFRKVPEVKNVTARVEPWSSKVYVELAPATERKRSIQQIIDAVRPYTSRMQPAFIYFEEEQQVGTKELIIEVFGYDYKILRQLAIGIANRLESIPGLTDMKIRMREGRPEMAINVERQRAATLHHSTQTVADQVHAGIRGLRATALHKEGHEIETITRLQEKYRKTFRDLYKLVLTDQESTPVLLEQVSSFKFDLGPSEIWRKNKDRLIQVSANIGKIPLSRAVEQVHAKLKDLEFPEYYYYRIGGDYQKLIKMGREMNMVVIMVVVLVYLVLAALFESFTQPIIIMSAIPLALCGALLGIMAGPKTIGIGAMLGMMMLTGIVTNHSVMLVDTINFYTRERRLKPLRAVILANKNRLRPILLTVLTTILGLVPMAIDRSEGANMWSPLALTVIGGLMSSLVLTLILMPAIYLSFEEAIRIIGSIPLAIRARLQHQSQTLTTTEEL